jgi:cell division protein FtsB
VVIHPSSRSLKIAIIVLIVFSMIALTALSWVRTSIRNRTEDMRQEAAALEDENADLKERLENPDALENIMELARELLGLVDPDTILIDPK